MTAVLFHLIAFFIAIDMTKADHFSFMHAEIGLTITIFAFLQPLFGSALFRPHGGTPTRCGWKIMHVTIGLFCMIMGQLNCLGGLDRLPQP
eukprot:UN19693